MKISLIIQKGSNRAGSSINLLMMEIMRPGQTTKVLTAPTKTIRKKKGTDFFPLLSDCQIRTEEDDLEKRVNLTLSAKCFALLINGKKLDDGALLNYVSPVIRAFEKASDAVHLLNVIEDRYTVNAENIERIRDQIKDAPWMNSEDAQTLRPRWADAPMGPLSW